MASSIGMRTPHRYGVLRLQRSRPGAFRALSLRACFFFITLVANVACADPRIAEDPVWGKQPCAHCKMLVSDPKYAAQLTTKRGDRLYFDDPGCLVREQARLGAVVEALWVRTAKGVWVDARAARYRDGANSPMNFGFAVDANGKFDFAAVTRTLLRVKK